MNKKRGFTIVELLVVIVVIGILATITIVSYTGISNKATVASLQSDLSSASTQLKMFNLENGIYPSSVSTNCATNPDTTSNKCLKLSSDNKLDTYNSPSPQTFVLSIKNGNNIYEVTEDSSPVSVVPVTLASIGATGGTVEVDSSLTAGTTDPVGASATALYQWQISNTLNGTYTDIAGASSNIYLLTSSEVGKYVRVKVTGTTRFPGTVYSTGVGTVAVSPWIAVGSQKWYKTNQNVGTRVNATVCGTDWNEGVQVYFYCNSVMGSKECYDNLESNCTTYGALYDLDIASNGTPTIGAQGICPTGSHIPSNIDWNTLITTLGGNSAAATALKPGGSSGLNLSKGGQRSMDGSFGWVSSIGYYWALPNVAYYINSSNFGSDGTYNRDYGYSIRCIKNS